MNTLIGTRTWLLQAKAASQLYIFKTTRPSAASAEIFGISVLVRYHDYDKQPNGVLWRGNQAVLESL